jgi:hypothetical protein
VKGFVLQYCFLTIHLSLEPLAVDVAEQVDHVALIQAELVVELSDERVPGVDFTNQFRPKITDNTKNCQLPVCKSWFLWFWATELTFLKSVLLSSKPVRSRKPSIPDNVDSLCDSVRLDVDASSGVAEIFRSDVLETINQFRAIINTQNLIMVKYKKIQA